MDDLISRKALLDEILDLLDETDENISIMPDVVALIRRAPAADIAPVRHAKWISEEHEDRVSPTMTHKYTWYYCSECGRRLVGYSKLSDVPYCHCGAKMDGGDEAAEKAMKEGGQDD